MTITEIFPNPTVKQVIFQITFPNLFFIESKIGDYQLKIMKDFPQSSMSYRKKFLIMNVGPKGVSEDLRQSDEDFGKKLWQFESEKKYTLTVTSDSLDITSEYHKTYNLGDTDKFRDIIEKAVGSFLSVVKIPLIKRIGFRYIDECPLPKKDNETFQAYYDNIFPLERFRLQDSEEMFFRTRVKRDGYYLIYMATVTTDKDNSKLILDFDGFATDIDSQKYLEVTDKLHDLITKEYEQTIKEPVLQFMRKKVEQDDHKL